MSVKELLQLRQHREYDNVLVLHPLLGHVTLMTDLMGTH